MVRARRSAGEQALERPTHIRQGRPTEAVQILQIEPGAGEDDIAGDVHRRLVPREGRRHGKVGVITGSKRFPWNVLFW